MRRYLVVANETLGDSRLVDAVKQRMVNGDCRFHVLVPVPGPTTIFGSAIAACEGAEPGDDDSRAAAADALDVELDRFRALGADVDGEVGSHDPLEAIRDTLDGAGGNGEAFDEIILATLPAGPSKWFHADLPHRLTKAFGIPVASIEFDTAHRDRTPAGTDPCDDWPPDDDHFDVAAQVAAGLDDLERDIERVRIHLGRRERRGERHFIDDDQPLSAHLEARSARLRHLTAIHRAAPAPVDADPMAGRTESRIQKLDADIERLRSGLAGQRDDDNRHFCD
ncbi:MAG: hypothetical protein M3Y36_09485 [Actinomycetota bacterium]|nr:hypothetical protein [Actinomycetota bacterium]